MPRKRKRKLSGELKNKPLDDEVDYIRRLGLKWYMKYAVCPSCNRSNRFRKPSGVCMGCVIEQQKRESK